MTAMTGLVLAGGRSRRFGSNKALARWGERTVVEAVCDALRSTCSSCLVVTKSPSDFQFLEAECTLVQDQWLEAHALGGICSGLQVAPTLHSFVSSCDVPLLQPAVVSGILAASVGSDITVPVW